MEFKPSLGTMVGYWPAADPADADAAFFVDPAGRRFFRTREVVEVLPEGDLVVPQVTRGFDHLYFIVIKLDFTVISWDYTLV